MPEWTWQRVALLIGVLWLCLYSSFALLSPPLLDDADSVHAEVAREMVLRGDPVTLYANGIRYLEKAPLLYWSMAASMRVFGAKAEAARFPLAVYALLLFLVTAWFGRRAFASERTALYAGTALLLSFGLFIFTRILIPDVIVCLWLTAAIFCFWCTEDEGSRPLLPCIGFGAACALNILTKGLIGLVFPLGTVLLYLLATRGLRGTLRRLVRLHPFSTLLTFLLVAAPWHLAAGRANPTEGHPPGLTHTGPWLLFWRGWHVGEPTLGNVHGWTWFYFMNEHVLRYLNLRVPRDYDTVPLVLFWGLLFVWLMPWSAYLPHALAAVPWRGVWRREKLLPEQRALLLLAIAALLPVLFFSFSTRQEHYVLPAMPFCCLLVARWLDREAAEAESMSVPAPLSRSANHIATVLLVGGALAAMVCAFFLLQTRPPDPHTDLSRSLQQNPGEYALSFGHFLDLNGAAMGAFRAPLLMTGAAMFLGTLLAWRQRRAGNPQHANLSLAVATLVFLLAAHKGLNTFSPVLTSEPLARAIAPVLHRSNLLVINDEYEAGSTLGFYLQRTDIHILHGHSANLWYGSFFTDAPLIFENDASIRLKWLGPERIFLWTDPSKLPDLPSKAYVIAEGGGKEIVSNKAGEY